MFGENKHIQSLLENATEFNEKMTSPLSPSIDLLSIAASFPAGYHIEYFDENYEAIQIQEHYDIIIVEADTALIKNALKIIESFCSDTLKVLFSVNTIFYEMEKMLKTFNVLFIGEAELYIKEFIADFEAGRIKSIYRSKEGQYLNMRECVMPRYDLSQKYRYRFINVQTMRGCSKHCSHCVVPGILGNNFRRKCNQNLEKEIKHVMQCFPDAAIVFTDCNAAAMIDEFMEFLHLLKKLKIRWIASVDLTIITDDVALSLMKSAGCKRININLYSITHKNLRSIEKSYFKLEFQSKYAYFIDKIHSYGMEISGFFILGLDHDTANCFAYTEKFIVDSKLDAVRIETPIPLPGTRLREDYSRKGKILNSDWYRYAPLDVVIRPEKLTTVQLIEGLSWVYVQLLEYYRKEQTV